MWFGFVAGETSKTIYVRLRDSSTGLAKTGLAYNSSGASAYYTLPLAAPVAISLATQTPTGSWSSGGFVEVDAAIAKGLYRLDLPNAAIASGAFFIINIQFTGVISEAVEVELDYRRTNVIQIGGTAQTGRDIGASVLLSSGTGTGQLDFTSGVVKSNLVQMGGVAQSATDLKDFADTGYDPSDHMAAADVRDWNGTGATLQKGMSNGFPQVDALYLMDSSPDTVIGQQVQDELDILYTTATGTPTSTTVQLADGSSVDNFYKDQLIYIRNGTGIGQARPILSYTGASKTVTVDEPFIVTPASGDVISIRVAHVHPVSQIADVVWDEATSGHTTSGTFGEQLKTDVDAIKTKTDNLPASPSAVGDAMTLTSGERSSIATAVWAAGTRTLSSFGSLVADVWSYVTRTLTGGDSGSGAYVVNLTVTDEDDMALAGAKVRVSEVGGARSYISASDADGLVSFSLDAVTWTVSITKPLYSFTPEDLVVSANADETYVMTSVAVPVPDSPDMCTLAVLCVDHLGEPEPGAKVKTRLVEPSSGSGIALDSRLLTTTADDDGLATITVVRGGVYEVFRGNGERTRYTIPTDQNVVTLTNFIGND